MHSLEKDLLEMQKPSDEAIIRVLDRYHSQVVSRHISTMSRRDEQDTVTNIWRDNSVTVGRRHACHS